MRCPYKRQYLRFEHVADDREIRPCPDPALPHGNRIQILEKVYIRISI
jgi:hypothetical protein